MAHFGLCRGVITLESCTKYQYTGRSAAQNLVKSTIFKGLTFKSIPDTIKT
jgi:hypothetical protein